MAEQGEGGRVEEASADSGYHIAAAAEVMERQPRILKAGESFALFDLHGDIDAAARAAEGVFHDDTRYLSTWRLRLGGVRPLLVRSSVHPETRTLRVDLTNPDILHGEAQVAGRESLVIDRRRGLEPGLCRETLRIANRSDRMVALPALLEFGADFRDMFQIRGHPRKKSGRRRPDRITADGLVLSFAGADGVLYETTLAFRPAPDAIEGRTARFDLRLAPGAETAIEIEIRWRNSARDVAASLPPADPTRAFAADLGLASGHLAFDTWIARSRADLETLATPTPYGLFPFGGVPWYCTTFGRDGILTAFLTLWADPSLARGVLGYLAAAQARDSNAAESAEPGKILHERRKGEMARLGEVPFGRFYGSIDSTPLFVMLAAAYWRRTGDAAFIGAIWQQILAALGWMERYGDPDGDGFIEYGGKFDEGWRDSPDAVFHADGRIAEKPIALCEVQAYAFAAWQGAALLARAIGAGDGAQYRARAEALRRRFEAAFWCEEIGCYGLALDGAKQPCRVPCSSAGHALFAGIAAPERAAQVAARLMAPAFFAGWGIRTIGEDCARFNPVSYHNGSIWPHDNALIALGLSRYGRKAEARRLAEGIFRASAHFDLRRLPEVFAGFREDESGGGPGRYPIACAMQAWSSAAAFGLLAACLGLDCDAEARRLVFRHPVLPEPLRELTLRNLRFGADGIDLRIRGDGERAEVEALGGSGRIAVAVER
ncbi:MAG TPA: glycogen debranching N-terminal domain-containing protein [Stellaceae bacterium]|nr:glycogen debranching N-terminal domain-containing protein [Stellaceae bacterium]